MASNRIGRINEEIQKELSSCIRNLKDPRVQDTMISITRVETTPDLRYAKVYVSILEEENRKPMMAALKKAAGFVRHQLRENMIIRTSPEILFELDQNIEYGIHIASVLKQVHAEEDNDDDADDQD